MDKVTRLSHAIQKSLEGLLPKNRFGDKTYNFPNEEESNWEGEEKYAKVKW